MILYGTEMAMGGAQQKRRGEEVVEVKVGVVIDLRWEGRKMELSCIYMALSDLYAPSNNGFSYNTRLVLHTRDTKGDVVVAASSVLDLIKNMEVQAIIGPSTSMEAAFLANLADRAQVPIVSYSATSPSVSSTKNQFFFRANQQDSFQVQAISALMRAFGWRQAVPVYVDDEYGSGLIPFLIDALQEVDTRVPYRSIISPLARDDQILEELYKLKTMQTRVFIVHMSPALGSRLFRRVKEAGMMSEGYVWIVTNGLTDVFALMDPLIVQTSMQGVLGVRTHYPRTQRLDNFKNRWKRQLLKDNPNESHDVQLNIHGLRAYDATVALAKAVEHLGAANYSYKKPNATLGNLTDLETLGVSQIGHELRRAILSTSFQGLSGDFRLPDGQLLPAVFEIVNVIGNGPRGIGFWTRENGLMRELDSDKEYSSASTTSKLGAIIWPGETTSPPKGWAIPTSGKRLRIGVPVKDGFTEFVKVTTDRSNNKSTVTGYSIDVFNAVMESLEYCVPYDFIPFANANGDSNGTYDELINQVYIQNFDAVVGDTTILAKRSRYVDFTLPYTESGVSMIVPIKDSRNKNAWVFLKPLTWELWCTSFYFFIFIGFVIWVLEHRINEDFRGPPSHQAGVIFWFSFSTMVFAHRERVISNLARFVVIVWAFVVLILTQSYTASLTSLLTVQQLQPTVTDIHSLQKRGDFVGYQQDSFVLEFLKQMKFNERMLIPYSSLEELDEALSKGSANGGIAAAFDEIPFIKLLLGRYCSKYAMVQPTYKTDGLGFVFPRGSPLVSDVSRAVLNVTEGAKMTEIEAAWFSQTSCPDNTPSVSNSLGLNSFWGLFLIAGVASIFSLLVFTAAFLYQNQDVFSDPENSLSSIGVKLAQRFADKDLTSHTFQKTAPCPPTTPLSISDQPDFSPFREQGTSTMEFDSPDSRDEEGTETPPALMLTEDPTQDGQRAFHIDMHH